MGTITHTTNVDNCVRVEGKKTPSGVASILFLATTVSKNVSLYDATLSKPRENFLHLSYSIYADWTLVEKDNVARTRINSMRL